MTAPTAVNTVTVAAPDEASALVLSWGRHKNPHDFATFVEDEFEYEMYEDATVLPVMEDDHREHVVRGVPVEQANHVYMAGRIFDLEHRVRELNERLNRVGATLAVAGDHLRPPWNRRMAPDIGEQS